MPRRARLAVLLALVILAPVPAAADTVVLKNGRELHGRIEEEGREVVVLKTPMGRVSIRRADVEKVIRATPAVTALEDARVLARALDPKADAAFERAIKLARDAKDEATEKTAEAERAKLRAVLEKQARSGQGPAGPTTGPDLGKETSTDAEEAEIKKLEKAGLDGDLKAALEAVGRLLARSEARHKDEQCNAAVRDHVRARELVQKVGRAAKGDDATPFQDAVKRLDQAESRCRLEAAGRAIREGEGVAAQKLLEPFVKAKGETPARVRYLVARAKEVQGLAGEALEELREVAGVGRGTRNSESIDLMRYAAKHAVVTGATGGLKLVLEHTWTRVEEREFCLFHDLEEPPAGFAAKLSEVKADARTRLGLSAAAGRGLVRTPVFLFGKRGDYGAAGGFDWSGGHALPLRLEDGSAVAVFTFLPEGRAKSLSATFEHEFAHVVVDESLRTTTLPGWALEGSATFAENDRSRRGRRADAARKRQEYEPLLEFLGQTQRGYSEAPSDVRRFYSQSFATFAALASRAGSAARVLEEARKIERTGALPFLKALGFADAADVEREITSVLATIGGEQSDER